MVAQAESGRGGRKDDEDVHDDEGYESSSDDADFNDGNPHRVGDANDDVESGFDFGFD